MDKNEVESWYEDEKALAIKEYNKELAASKKQDHSSIEKHFHKRFARINRQYENKHKHIIEGDARKGKLHHFFEKIKRPFSFAKREIVKKYEEIQIKYFSK